MLTLNPIRGVEGLMQYIDNKSKVGEGEGGFLHNVNIAVVGIVDCRFWEKDRKHVSRDLLLHILLHLLFHLCICH